jgi:trans-aconitate methyltransferase
MIYNSNGPRIPDALKKILDIPFFYNLMQNLGGHNRTTTQIVTRMKTIYKDLSVIDLGCGPGNITGLIDINTAYLGIDLHEPYVSKAKQNYPNRDFIHGSILDLPMLVPFLEQKTLFFALGLFHHLSDGEVGELIKGIKTIRPNFVIASLDPCFCEYQTALSRFLANSDRGKFVRSDKDLQALLARHSLEAKNMEVSDKYMRTKMFLLIGEWVNFGK